MARGEREGEWQFLEVVKRSLPENKTSEQRLEVRNYHMNGWERTFWEEKQFMQKLIGGSVLS